MRLTSIVTFGLIAGFCAIVRSPVYAQAKAPQKAEAAKVDAVKATTESTGVVPPVGYVIGADDMLTIRFWGDAQMSVDAIVRPDGKISLPLINDVQAAGLTPTQLNVALEAAASKFIAEPSATVIVREIRSRKVYVLGQVAKPTPLTLNKDMTVLQALSEVGGLLEYSDKKNIIILRTEDGRERRLKFNYNDVIEGKNSQQNILLKPGDTIVVN